MAVRGDVFFGSVFGMVAGMEAMGVRQVCVVGGFLMVAGFVVLRGFLMVPRGMFVMLGGVPVMLGCFGGHGFAPFQVRFGLDICNKAELWACGLTLGMTEG